MSKGFDATGYDASVAAAPSLSQLQIEAGLLQAAAGRPGQEPRVEQNPTPTPSAGPEKNNGSSDAGGQSGSSGQWRVPYGADAGANAGSNNSGGSAFQPDSGSVVTRGTNPDVTDQNPTGQSPAGQQPSEQNPQLTNSTDTSSPSTPVAHQGVFQAGADGAVGGLLVAGVLPGYAAAAVGRIRTENPQIGTKLFGPETTVRAEPGSPDGAGLAEPPPVRSTHDGTTGSAGSTSGPGSAAGDGTSHGDGAAPGDGTAPSENPGRLRPLAERARNGLRSVLDDTPARFATWWQEELRPHYMTNIQTGADAWWQRPRTGVLPYEWSDTSGSRFSRAVDALKGAVDSESVLGRLHPAGRAAVQGFAIAGGTAAFDYFTPGTDAYHLGTPGVYSALSMPGSLRTRAILAGGSIVVGKAANMFLSAEDHPDLARAMTPGAIETSALTGEFFLPSSIRPLAMAGTYLYGRAVHSDGLAPLLLSASIGGIAAQKTHNWKIGLGVTVGSYVASRLGILGQ